MKNPRLPKPMNAKIQGLVEQAARNAIGISREDYDKGMRFRTSGKGVALEYFGANHSNDPDHPQFAQAKERFEQTFSGVPKEECAVIVEADVSHAVDDGTDEATCITRSGEPAQAIYLAKRSGIDYFCFEPEMSLQIDYVSNNFSKDLAYLYFVGRAIRNFGAKHTEGLRKYLELYIERFKQDSNWEDFDYSFEHLNDIYMGLTGRDFTPSEQRTFENMVDPRNNTSILDEVSRKSQTYRDVCIISNAHDLLERGKTHFFFMYGSGHALTQRSALEYVLENV